MLIVVAVLHFIVALHSFCSSFCCCYSSFHCFLCDVDLLIAFQFHPSPFRGLSLDFYTHFILSAQPIAEWFATLSFPTFPRSSFRSFIASAIVLSWHFLPTGVFYLMLLDQELSAFIKASLEADSFSLKFSGLHTDFRNTNLAHPFVWFTVMHNLHIQNDSFLNSTKHHHELLVVKSLVYMLLNRLELFLLVQSICKDY